MYIVRRGDTLSAIAKRYYGSGSGYRAIYKANRDRVRNPHLIYPRQRLYIPHRRRDVVTAGLAGPRRLASH